VPLRDSVTLSATVTDRLGRKFDNFSSLIIDWITSDNSVGTLKLDDSGNVLGIDKMDGPFTREYPLMK